MELKSPNWQDLTIAVIDNGLFTHTAIKLAETGARVLYYTPWINAFPKSNATLPGDGLKGIERIRYIEPYEEQIGLYVFPDVMFGPVQARLVKEGKRVWGGRTGEQFELDRWETKLLMKSWNMPVNETHRIIGMEALRRFLQEREERGPWWIKTSLYRGDFETFESESYDDVETRLDEVAAKLGKKAAIYPFIVERHIEAITEVGFDGYNIDGQFPQDNDPSMFGCEKKDVGYVGVAKLYGDFPPAVRWVNEKVAPYMKARQYRGFFSSEIRCTEENQFEGGDPDPFEDFEVTWHDGPKVPGTDMYAFLTDPCCRMASPPGEAYIEWAGNWPEIIWHGAGGLFVPVEPVARYAVEIMLHSSFADANWQPVRYPEEIAQWVKLRNCCKIGDVHYSVPQSYGLPEVGAVVALDDNLLTAARTCIERSQLVKGFYLEAKHDAVAKAILEINEAQEQGIEFTDEPLPTAEELEELQPG